MTAVRKNLIRILDSWIGVIFFVIALFFLVTPFELNIIPFILNCRNLILAILFVILAVLFLIIESEDKAWLKHQLLLIGTVFWGIVFMISLTCNGKGRKEPFWDTVCMAFISILLIAVFTRINIKKYLFAFFIFFLVYNTINNSSIFFFHNTGMWADYTFTERDINTFFLGHVNAGIYSGMLSMMSGLIYSWQYDNKWNKVNVINIIFSLCYAIIADSESQIVIYIVIAVVLVLCEIVNCFSAIQKVLKWINAKTLLLLDLLIFDAVVVLGNTGWMEIIGLDPRMHGRRELWDAVLETIIDHPVIGFGYQSWLLAEINGVTHIFWHQHSFYLQTLYETGIIGTIVFAFILIVVIMAIDKIQTFNVRFIMGVMFGLLFLFLVNEVMERVYLFLFLAFFYYVSLYLPGSNNTDDIPSIT